MQNNKYSIIKKLNLKPLEPEGGFFRQTYLSNNGYGTAIYYLIDEKNFSQLHRLKCDEIFHFYFGASVEMVQIDQAGKFNAITLGMNPLKNEHCQVHVPAGVWQGIRIKKNRGWALLGATCFPAFSLDQFELGNKNTLIREFPNQRMTIERYIK